MVGLEIAETPRLPCGRTREGVSRAGLFLLRRITSRVTTLRSCPHNGSRNRSFSRKIRGIRTSPAGSDARKAAQIVKERWFPLPGQPQAYPKTYCNNISMYLSSRIHPEIPGGDTGLSGSKAQMYSQPLTARLKTPWTGSTRSFASAQDFASRLGRRDNGAS